MKKAGLLLVVCILLVLTACGNKTDNQKEDTLDKPIVVDNLKMNVKAMDTAEKVSDKKKQTLYTFTVSGENVSSSKKGLGSIDFILKTEDGKEVKIDDSLATFGDEIEPGKSIEGKVYFSLGEGQKASKLIYKPADKELAEWDVSK
ncbi:DUF4352 domain-containing protein [Listeria ilorinensis]|uniref:DUF4352 domain-containing protein n=1 Tax=Listeria ilorinensis TaxID=2867439 RepID=UPI001EF508AA|nr:DUF4352 domain-containing protein [Listeria ilorinensis]